jgi:Fe-S cluster assembly ATP-binding protein
MLEIKNLKAQVEDKEVLKGLNLSVRPGEVHAIMGPNGSGKSTFSKVLAGHPDYKVTGGEINYEINLEMKNLLDLESYQRALEGVFIAYQYPTEIPGVSNFEFLKVAFNSVCKYQGANELSDSEFELLIQEKAKLVKINPSFLYRSLNEGFSGGEKKRNEILQMALLAPRLCILDETDSGLDIDSLKIVSDGVNALRSDGRAIILITHYQRLLDYIVPDFVHVFKDGKIIKTGDKSLALELEKKGYDWL